MKSRSRLVSIVALCELTFHLAGVWEIYMTLQLIGSPTSVLIAFILEAVNRILNIVFAFVPAMVGVDEAGTGLLANVLGFRHHRRHHVGDCSQSADVGLDWICCF